jgi:hypothetical protein
MYCGQVGSATRAQDNFKCIRFAEYYANKNLLQRPAGCVPLHGCDSSRAGTVPLWNQETAGWVSFDPFLIAVLMPQCVLDLPHRVDTFGARLPLPEKDKSLTADATASFCVSLGALAQDLHFLPAPGLLQTPQPRDKPMPSEPNLPMPFIGRGALFCSSEP